MVDYIAKVETLNSDWKDIADKIDCNSNLSKHNTSNHKSYEEHLTQKSMDFIKEYYESQEGEL